MCDWADCPNVAEEVIGAVRELRAFVAVCPEHAALFPKHGNPEPR
jgi:hypothetical protein